MEIVFGIIAGIVAGMGMGGGTILILLLTLFMQLGQHESQGVNLIFYIPTSIVAIFINLKNKNIDIKLGNQLAIFGFLGAIIGGMIGTVASDEIYDVKKKAMKAGKKFLKKYDMM